jgi:hypothetical protein
MKELAVMLTFLIFTVFVSGCIMQNDEETNSTEINDISEESESHINPATDIQSFAIVLCKNMCQDALGNATNLAKGPCLSDNNTDWIVSDWVCDVANSPRQSVDDLSENQCRAYSNGTAHHFVEVSTNCTLIRAV